MRNAIFVFLIIVLGLAAFIAYNAVFIVHQTQTALVLQFGNPKKVITTPGLNLKIPLAQTVEFFDKRILDTDLPQKEVIAADQKRLVVDAFARYKIIDPLLFFQSVTNEIIAKSRLDNTLDSVMRSILGGADFFEIVKTRRTELMHNIAVRVDNEAKSFGIQVVDVRLRRVSLPTANSNAIYERMKTERQREAAEIRAKGTEEAKRIRANGDGQVTEIIAKANSDSERIRGDGDGERNRIYAEAFGKDPDFFAFYRSMQAYEEGLKSDATRLVISPTSEFFDYFNNQAGRTGTAKQPPKPATPSPTSAPPSQAAR